MATKKSTKPEEEKAPKTSSRAKRSDLVNEEIASEPAPRNDEPKAKKTKVSTSEKAKTAEAAKTPKNPLDKRGKKYRKAYELIEQAKGYELAEAIALVKKSSTTKFDASVDIHVNLGVDPLQSDQIVRTSTVLPGGSAKTPSVKIIKSGAEGEKAIAEIEKGKIDFDVLITTPDMMPKLAKVAKVLGPKGLMPNPKSGTVTPDPAKAEKEIKSGKVELRIDKQAIIHQSVGRVSFDGKNLAENIKAVVTALQQAKPSGSKGTYIQAMALATSMGPSVKLDPQKVLTELHK